VADSLVPLMDKHNAVLLSNHGVVTCGADLLTAFFRVETVEQLARITLVTEVLGKQSLLSGGDVEKLLAGRATAGASGVQGETPSAAWQAAGFSSEVETGTRLAERGARPGEARVSLTRRELEELIEEALRQDRARR
jgi:Class II Aldolase and Adducin N-terminal domain